MKNKLLKMFVQGRINRDLYEYVCKRITPEGSRTRVEPKDTTVWKVLSFVSLAVLIAMLFIILPWFSQFKIDPGSKESVIENFIVITFLISGLFLAISMCITLSFWENNYKFYNFYYDLVDILGPQRFWNLLDTHHLSHDDILLSVKMALISHLSGLIGFERHFPEFRLDSDWERHRSNLNRVYTKAVIRFPELEHEKGWGQFMKEAEDVLDNSQQKSA